MRPWLQKISASFIWTGTFRVTTAGGRTFTLGDGTGRPIAVRFTSLAAELGVLLDPELKLGEAYMDGTFVVDEGSIADFVALALSQSPRPIDRSGRGRNGWHGTSGIGCGNSTSPAEPEDPPQPEQKSPTNTTSMERFIRSSSTLISNSVLLYSKTPDQFIEQAQLAKKRHLAAKRLLEPGSHVLDLGSGWAGLAFYLAEVCGARVTGVTPSEEQIARSKARADEKELAGNVQFRCEDFRDVTGVLTASLGRDD